MKHYTKLARKEKRFSPAQAELEYDGTRFPCEIVHTGKDSLDLSFDESRKRPPDRFEAESITLICNGQNISLRNANATATMLSPLETIIRVQTQDPFSKNQIWNLTYELIFLTGSDAPEIADQEYFDVPLRGHYTKEKCVERLEWMRRYVEEDLKAIGEYRIDPARLKGNVENFIGCIEIPVGLAGPLLFHGQHADGYILAPFATTEGALVASACRGAKALSQSGGVRTLTIHQQMMRAPVFVTNSIADAHKLQHFILDHREEIMAEIRLVSRRANLINLRVHMIGSAIHVRFIYETGDAAGQNMTTAATWKACQWILAQTAVSLDIEIRQFMVESNLSGDKKVNYLSYISGRGIRVTAEAFLPDSVLQSVLKVSADQLAEAANTFMSGSLTTGMIGFNINIANTIAAIFAATGQDIACVHESSIGQLQVQKQGDGVYVSMLLPSLIIGTVGGGTGLPTQKDCLKLLGCDGADKVFKLAEIIAGFSLALDLSTLSAITSGQFASAHEKLGRNHPEDGLQEKHLTPEFFNTTLNNIPQFASDEGLHVVKIENLSLDTQNSILSELTSSSLRKKIGHFAYDVYWENPVNKGVRRIVIKAKPTDLEVINMINQMAQGCGARLASIHELFKRDTGFRKCHIREMEIYRLENKGIKMFMPEVFYTWRDDDHEIFAIAMAYLEEVILKDTVMMIETWTDDYIRIALKGLAMIHSVFYNKTDQLADKEWLSTMNREKMITMTPLWEALRDHSAQEFPQLFPSKRSETLTRLIEKIPDFWKTIEGSTKTLIHNDFNPRNICLQKFEDEYRLCAYDWELSSLHVPSRDVCEFLAFILPPGTAMSRRLEFIEFYRRELENVTETKQPEEKFMKEYHAACFDFAVNRLQLYVMAHTFKDYQFLPRVLDAHYEYMESIL